MPPLLALRKGIRGLLPRPILARTPTPHCGVDLEGLFYRPWSLCSHSGCGPNGRTCPPSRLSEDTKHQRVCSEFIHCQMSPNKPPEPPPVASKTTASPARPVGIGRDRLPEPPALWFGSQSLQVARAHAFGGNQRRSRFEPQALPRTRTPTHFPTRGFGTVSEATGWGFSARILRLICWKSHL